MKVKGSLLYFTRQNKINYRKFPFLTRYKSRLDDNVSRMHQLWSSVLRRADDYKEQVGRQVDRLKELQGSIDEMMKWMNEIETHSGFTVPSCASIQQMKVHFEHVKVWEVF